MAQQTADLLDFVWLGAETALEKLAVNPLAAIGHAAEGVAHATPAAGSGLKSLTAPVIRYGGPPAAGYAFDQAGKQVFPETFESSPHMGLYTGLGVSGMHGFSDAGSAIKSRQWAQKGGVGSLGWLGRQSGSAMQKTPTALMIGGVPLTGYTSYERGKDDTNQKWNKVVDQYEQSLPAAQAPAAQTKGQPQPATGTTVANGQVNDKPKVTAPDGTETTGTPNWAKGLGIGGGALLAGYLANHLTGEEEDPETGEKKKRAPWLGPLVGAGALGAGAYYLKGDRPWGDMLNTDFWKHGQHVPLVLVGRTKFASSLFPSIPGLPHPPVPPTPPPVPQEHLQQPIPQPQLTKPVAPPPPGMGSPMHPSAPPPNSAVPPVTQSGTATVQQGKTTVTGGNMPAQQIDEARQQMGGAQQRANSFFNRVRTNQQAQQPPAVPPGQPSAQPTPATATPPAAEPGVTGQSGQPPELQTPANSPAPPLSGQQSGQAAGVASNVGSAAAPGGALGVATNMGVGEAHNRQDNANTANAVATGLQGGLPGGAVGSSAGMVDRLAQTAAEKNPQAADENTQKQNIAKQLVQSGHEESPSMWDQVMKIWDGLSTPMKILVGAGLSLGALSLLGGLTGSESLGGGTGMLMGLGGLAAAAYGLGAFDDKSPFRQAIGGLLGTNKQVKLPEGAIVSGKTYGSIDDLARDPALAPFFDTKNGQLDLTDDGKAFLLDPNNNQSIHQVYENLAPQLKQMFKSKIDEAAQNPSYMRFAGGRLSELKNLFSQWDTPGQSGQGGAVQGSPFGPAANKAGPPQPQVDVTTLLSAPASPQGQATPGSFEAMREQFRTAHPQQQADIVRQLEDMASAPAPTGADATATATDAARENAYERAQSLRDVMVDGQMHQLLGPAGQQVIATATRNGDTRSLQTLDERMRLMLRDKPLQSKYSVTAQNAPQAQEMANQVHAALQQRFQEQPIAGANARAFSEYLADPTVDPKQREQFLANLHPQRKVEFASWLHKNVEAPQLQDTKTLSDPNAFAKIVERDPGTSKAMIRKLVWHFGGKDSMPVPEEWNNFKSAIPLVASMQPNEPPTTTVMTPQGPAQTPNPKHEALKKLHAAVDNIQGLGVIQPEPIDYTNPGNVDPSVLSKPVQRADDARLITLAKALMTRKEIVGDADSVLRTNAMSAEQRAADPNHPMINPVAGYTYEIPTEATLKGSTILGQFRPGIGGAQGALTDNEVAHGQYIPGQHPDLAKQFKPLPGFGETPAGYQVGPDSMLRPTPNKEDLEAFPKQVDAKGSGDWMNRFRPTEGKQFERDRMVSTLQTLDDKQITALANQMRNIWIPNKNVDPGTYEANAMDALESEVKDRFRPHSNRPQAPYDPTKQPFVPHVPQKLNTVQEVAQDPTLRPFFTPDFQLTDTGEDFLLNPQNNEQLHQVFNRLGPDLQAQFRAKLDEKANDRLAMVAQGGRIRELQRLTQQWGAK